LFPKVSAFHAVSDAIAKEALKYNANLNHIHVVKSGLKLAEFPFELKAFDPDTQLNIISVGRNHWIKNYRMALDVIFRLKQQGINIHYKIIGAPNSEALVFQRDQLGLTSQVSFIELMPFEDVQTIIKEADVMLLTSIKEGIANVVLEAMALGTLVVSTDCGGMAEVVIPDQTGYLVPIRDPETMAKALKTVSELPLETYQKITKQARGFVEEYHNEGKMIMRMQGLYERVSQKE
jgi:colanic acid/amylovoran biosynthesis glycosyltransferase